MPGLIDCHTHLVYAGDRAGEFERRLAGASYEEIARAGGGILSTVTSTRQAGEADLVLATLPRLDALLAEGVTTIEIKSGYGLELATEARQLRAARAVADQRQVDVVTTFLGARALPPEAAGDKDQFIARVCDEMQPAIATEGLADAVDGFCETIGFSPAQIARVFAAAKRHGLPVKLHADQLSDLGGAALAAEAGALSADHLEYASEDGAAAMARAGTVAVLLPGAYYFIRETHPPPVGAFRRHGVPLALATDSNPGSPLTSLLLAMNMGATLFRLTVDECIAGLRGKRRARWGGCTRSARWRPASGAIWPSGTSSNRPIWFTALASTRCTAVSGKVDDHEPPRQYALRARGTRHRADSQDMADRGAVAHADEQPRSRCRGAPGRACGVWRHRAGGTRLGQLRPHHGGTAAARAGPDAAGAVRQACRRVPDASPMRRAC